MVFYFPNMDEFIYTFRSLGQNAQENYGSRSHSIFLVILIAAAVLPVSIWHGPRTGGGNETEGSLAPMPNSGLLQPIPSSLRDVA